MTLADLPREGESIYGQGAKPDYRIDPATGCWEWLKATYRGYASRGDGIKPHRAYYQRAFGQIPEGHHVHHKCHNPGCVNPEHLEAIPHKEHIAQHMAKRWGLELETVKEIRRLGLEPGARAAEVAKRFGIDRRAVGRYWSGETWPELGGRVEPAMKTCPECGAEHNHGRRHRVYCSKACQIRFKSRKRRARLKGVQ